MHVGSPSLNPSDSAELVAGRQGREEAVANFQAKERSLSSSPLRGCVTIQKFAYVLIVMPDPQSS